jgi:hypothetical protein
MVGPTPIKYLEPELALYLSGDVFNYSTMPI